MPINFIFQILIPLTQNFILMPHIYLYLVYFRFDFHHFLLKCFNLNISVKHHIFIFLLVFLIFNVKESISALLYSIVFKAICFSFFSISNWSFNSVISASRLCLYSSACVSLLQLTVGEEMLLFLHL